MKRTIHILSVLFFLLAVPAFSGEFVDSGSAFSVNFSAGWTEKTSDEPAIVLKLERAKSFFEFSKLDSELSEYYLKARVKEQVDSLRSKGNTISGEVRHAAILGGAPAYYTDYESMGARVYMAFFTHNGFSYAISASGLQGGEFRRIIATIRKPGEKIPAPKPKKVKVAYRRPVREKKAVSPRVSKEAAVSASTVAAVAAPVSGASPAGAAMGALAEAEILRSERSARQSTGSGPKTKKPPISSAGRRICAYGRC